MFEIDKFHIKGKSFQGVKVTLPDLPPLILIKGDRGFVMCGYLNLEVAEKLEATAAIVSGVNNFDDVLNAKIKSATTKANELGLEPGKVVKEVIENLNY
ncbi:DUF1805 domain-containing protein [Candidatus Bathyarchaeota archaeon]|jgi:uncharacterized protein YunC (DUF1805 family)|nr:DUF1805 domain-containing protein [Candidatus Bathyarchaeota archaeon]